VCRILCGQEWFYEEDRILLKVIFDAWNHRDSRGVADHLSADGIYRDVPRNFSNFLRKSWLPTSTNFLLISVTVMS